jgi:hypothetical protein
MSASYKHALGKQTQIPDLLPLHSHLMSLFSPILTLILLILPIHMSAEYVNIHKQRPEDPFSVFCVSLAFVHVASQKYINSKNSVVVQVMIIL